MIIYSYYNRQFMLRTPPIPIDRWVGDGKKYEQTRKNTTMNSDKMNHILDELRKPFHPSRITWRPGALTGKKDKALALAYADLRAYQNRLDEVCGMDWSVSYTPWSDRIICHLTINGITRSSTGEPDSREPSGRERSEIAGTTAEAQAFKRACAMFGLGRYLYNLPSVWVEYDTANQRFTDKAKVRLQGVIAQHYQRFLDGQSEAEADEAPEDVHVDAPVPAPVRDEAVEEEPAALEQPVPIENKGAENKEPPAAESQPATPVAMVAPVAHVVEANGKPHKVNGKHNHGKQNNDKQNDETLLPLRKTLDELGKELYGEQWTHVRAHNIKRLVGEQNDNNGALSQEQIQTLINGLKKLKQQRQAA